MLYYTLIPSRLVCVDEIAPEPDDGELPAFTSPRSIAVQDTIDLWNERDKIEYALDGRINLVGVSPCGEVTSAHVDGGGSEVLASQGWRVESILSLDQVLGPHAVGIRRVVTTTVGINQEADYNDVVEDIEELDERMSDLVQHAVDALHRADIDGAWWADQVGCTNGYELVALAASDLVAESSDWDMRAFHQLMRPWTRVMGWPTTQPCP